MNVPVDVLVCDDHRHFREGLVALLNVVEDVRVVGQAASGEEALAYVVRLQPDVVLMDLNMPGLNGVEATREITAASPHVGVVVLTMLADDESVFAAMRAGARGYLLKGASKTDIVRAVHAAAEGEALFGAEVAGRLMGYFAVPVTTAQADAFPQLTAREREILDLIAGHLTNPQIASRLKLSEKTVRNNVSNILVKLQAADRAQAIIAAREAGLGNS